MAKVPLHCGWKFKFDEKAVDSLREHIGDIALGKNIFVAVQYRKDCMQSWHDQRKGKISYGYVASLFVKKGVKPVVVGVIMVDARRDYVVMSNSTGMSPMDAKRQANKGLLGEEIKFVDKIKIECEPYIVFKDEKKN
ncbi:MAG: hypothetical protein Hyperionvirus2_59 [Hyperionvirus sp.]|uniref:Uncharacterized protein n=1 Tax=Hyperionvirus sp. TaxID=2487770 RepID=A0A3G5A935_9VIRU|nr:MAG: hypothetical protein Hyperionvirus2_59 [Hyperionvirus sp.]